MHVGGLAPHAYLAVDLFFLLSGFVLEHAYGARLAQGWSARAFLVRRIRRLYPLYALGLLIAVLAVGAALVLGRGSGWSAGSLAAAAAAGAVMAPLWTGGDTALYPLNFSAWTLLAELVANAAFALTYRRLSVGLLLVWTLGWALALALMTLGYGSLDAGVTWNSLPLGLARMAFAFPVGVLIRRLSRLTLPPAAGLLALLAAGAVLYAPAGPLDMRAYDLAAAVVVWPVLIALAAAAEVRGFVRRAAMEIGAASYGVYVTAVPAFILVHAVLRARGLATGILPWPAALLFCAGLFAAAFAVRRGRGARR